MPMLDFAARPDRGLICISKSSGIAIDKPVGTNSRVLGAIFIGLSINAIKSMPDDPLVLYSGRLTLELSLLTKTLTINLIEKLFY